MKKARRLMAAVMTAVMLALVCANGAAAAPKVVTVILDGSPVDFVDTNAQIIHDYTYVPIARIIEILTGSPPDWDPINKMASFSFNGSDYKIYTNQSGIYVNGVFHQFEAKPEIVNNRTLIPLRMLSDALGFGISWNGATSTVTLTSPIQSQAEVYSAEPSSVNVTAGSAVTISVTASGNAVEVKVRNPAGTTLAESKSYETVGENRRFTLTFTPQTSGTYCVYAACKDGFNVYSHKDVNVTLGAGTAVNSVELSRSAVSIGDTVTLSVYTTADATRVRLQSDNYSSDVLEQTNYTTSGSQRVFKIDWPIRSSYYSGRSYVSAKVYAGNSGGYTSSYKTATVNIAQPSAAVIYESYSSPSGINVNAASTIYVTTDTNTASVTFSIGSGGGSLGASRLTSYRDSGGRRYWENTFYAGTSAGTSRINVTAAPSSGSSATATVSVTVSGAPSTDGDIHDITVSPSYSVDEGTRVEIDISTGVDVSRITVSNSIDPSLSASMDTGTVYGSMKTWKYQFTVPTGADGYYDINITAFVGSVMTDMGVTAINVTPLFTTNTSNTGPN